MEILGIKVDNARQWLSDVEAILNDMDEKSKLLREQYNQVKAVIESELKLLGK